MSMSGQIENLLAENKRLESERAKTAAAIKRMRVALEKARNLHAVDPADHNVGTFIDEALSWISTEPG
jgi:hypothetical protein